MERSPERLKAAVASGLLSLPVTFFTGNGAFAPGPYQKHIDYLVGHRPAVLFAARGTGEFFSLQPAEYESVIGAAVKSAGGRLPIVAGVGYGTALAIEFARRAEGARTAFWCCRSDLPRRWRWRRRLPPRQLPVRTRHHAGSRMSAKIRSASRTAMAISSSSRAFARPWRPAGLCQRDAHNRTNRSKRRSPDLRPQKPLP